jgi:hypothetical protein
MACDVLDVARDLAPLVAVLVGVAALVVAGLERRDARADRDRERSISLLTALNGLLTPLHQMDLGVDGGKHPFDDNRAAVRGTLAAFGLCTRLPKTYALTERDHDANWTDRAEVFADARNEILELIESESDVVYRRASGS